jgi:hypothetical protein
MKTNETNLVGDTKMNDYDVVDYLLDGVFRKLKSIEVSKRLGVGECNPEWEKWIDLFETYIDAAKTYQNHKCVWYHHENGAITCGICGCDGNA